MNGNKKITDKMKMAVQRIPQRQPFYLVMLFLAHPQSKKWRDVHSQHMKPSSYLQHIATF